MGWMSSYPLLVALRSAAEDDLGREGLRSAMATSARDSGEGGRIPPDDEHPAGVVSAPDPGSRWGLEHLEPAVAGEVTPGVDHPADCEQGDGSTDARH